MSFNNIFSASFKDASSAISIKDNAKTKLYKSFSSSSNLYTANIFLQYE